MINFRGCFGAKISGALSHAASINHPFYWRDNNKAILLRMRAIMQIFGVCNKPRMDLSTRPRNVKFGGFVFNVSD